MPRKRSISPRKLPKQERSRITVEAILEATTRILTEEGYDKASTNHIAERAGIGIGSLYQYFPNKESIVAALMEQHSNEIAEIVESKLSHLFDRPIEMVIPELIKAAIAAHAINPRLHQVLNEEIPQSERLQQMQQAEKRIAGLLRAYLERWNDDIHPRNLEMTVFILGRTVESLCHSAVLEHPDFITNSQFEREVSDLLLFYLKRTN
ncbi:TetR/AcrR family transcriptional regulator [Chamaesiphon polymorphus]|uniref:TetR/AcrR family transcriptional regulator n=1 Tax=Chamaesiphon polymorphus CCALA 037 TaxID=2107692 RepID=A0A2T1GMI7_9CYAN|nr:TetR/AcrR family transcriptional regulator [Chamaesiphon polymorphus]PSB59102.1 TetR/AcrR family transcriptional regulator [Chamaesiphon polymorphus CCALA 037]